MKKFNIFTYLILLVMLIASSCKSQETSSSKDETIRLFAGKYTEAAEKGLYLFDLNREAGIFKLVSTCDAGPNPTYFCISKEKGLIYAANEVDEFNNTRGGGLTTLKYDSLKGGAEKVNELVVPNGGPCFISLSADEKFLFMANYGGGSVAVIKLGSDGIPESVTDTIVYKGDEGTRSHAHMIGTNPSGDKVYVTDLGLDRVTAYNLDITSGRLQEIPDGIATLPKGTGPRHFEFNSEGTKMYVADELNSTITVFNVDPSGKLTSVQTVSTLTDGFSDKNYPGDIHIGKSGSFLYCSNRGINDIITFKIEPDGLLSLAGHSTCGGVWPRNFVIDPSGKFIVVANQRSGNISVFPIDEKTGIPAETGKDYALTTPACLKF
ncbi:MAG TPA: lactonase family protein [Bacteroidales bacterium]|nr:lactonase family protein [Bacteroidales bacterium]